MLLLTLQLSFGDYFTGYIFVFLLQLNSAVRYEVNLSKTHKYIK